MMIKIISKNIINEIKKNNYYFSNIRILIIINKKYKIFFYILNSLKSIKS